MIGTVSASSYLHNDLSGRIIALVVSKELRQRDIGARLIAAAEKNFIQRGITRVTLTTRFDREKARVLREDRLCANRFPVCKKSGVCS